MEKEKENGRYDKRKLKNQIFPFCMIMWKFRITMQNRLESGIMLQAKGELSSWFRMIMRKFYTVMLNTLESCKCCCWNLDFSQPCEIGWARAKLVELMQNGHLVVKL